MIERTTAYLDVDLKSRQGQPEAPVSASYRVDCMTTGRPVRAATAIAPSARLAIVLTAEDNSVAEGAHPFEVHRVTVTATYGPSDLLVEEFDYKVQRARFR